ncbi:OsmC family protein [Yersinia sp. 2540 StPb PI]|uniref:OsmC family protein n=1 Tax=Yersinia sp. 2540 StPb PI TaxID=3117406 RepID=UPI003FA466F9
MPTTTAVKPFAAADAIQNTREAVRNQPGLGNLTIQMKARSNGRVSVRVETGATIQDGNVDNSRVGKFSNIGDEPEALMGTDSGMGPTEYILQALAGCYTATLTILAAEKGIDLDGIELDLNFDINLNGFLGLDSTVRKGAKSIRVDVHLASKSASREELEALVSEMQKSSPIHDTLANPVEMITRLV